LDKILYKIEYELEIRKIMKGIFTFLQILLLVFIFISTSYATGLLTEDFNYTAGTTLTTVSPGPGWIATNAGGTNPITISTTGGATGLSYTGYANSNVGPSVTLTTSGEDDYKNLSSAPASGTVYASAMIKVTSSQAGGDYFFALYSANGYNARLYIKNSTDGGFWFGAEKGGNGPVYQTGTGLTFGTTYLVVLKYTFNPGAADDQVALFVNPTLSSEPTPTLLAAVGTSNDAASIKAVALRQGSATSAPVVTIDGINAGTTWSDVTTVSGGGSPTFSVSGSLLSFSQTSSSASAEQTYTIGGSNLTNTVTITPPAAFEISKTTGSGFVTSTGNLTFTAAQVVANPTIYVRLHAGSPGSYTGNITHVSSDFLTVNKAASGIYPGFTVTGTLSAFSQISGTPSGEQTYTIGGTNLTNTVTITPPSGFEISKTTGSGFVGSTGNLTFTAAQVMANPTIFIRLNASSPGSYSGNITHTSIDFLTATLPASGTYAADNGRVLTLTALVEALYVTGGSAMTISPAVTVELHDAVSLALIDQQTGTLNTAGIGTFTFRTAVNGTNYYIVLKSLNTIETWSATPQAFTSNALNYNFTSSASQAFTSGLFSPLALHNGRYCIYSGDLDQNGLVSSADYTGVDNDNSSNTFHLVNDLDGNNLVTSNDYTFIDNNNALGITKQVPSVAVHTLSAVPGSLSGFTYILGAGPSASQSFSLSGSNLIPASGNITITGSADYEVSNNNSTWGSSAIVAYSSSTLNSTLVYVRLKSGLSAGNYNSENVSIAGGGAPAINVSCNGTVMAGPTLVAAPSSLSGYSYSLGSGPAVSQSFNLSGSNLTGAPGTITITSPSDYEVSYNNQTWVSSFTVAYSSSTLSGTSVYVRLKSGLAVGNYNSENVSIAGGGVSAFSVSCSGSVYALSGNVNLTMGNPSGATTDVNFPHNYLLDKPQFCASYDRDRGIPNWTSWQLNSAWCNGPGVRTDPYGPDLTLPAGWHRVGGNDFSGSGFARGHMCPSADRINTQANNDALFVMTNLDPQNQDNNAGAWEGLESYERVLANAGNTLYIICGGYGSGGIAPGTSTVVNTISSGQVTVPAKLWKVIIVVPAGSGSDISRVTTSTRTIALLINNDSVANNASLWGNYRVSVASIEALTGYTFFSNVPTSIGNVIKAPVDSGPTQ
jgi:endonuclease G, mitochondrial